MDALRKEQEWKFIMNLELMELCLGSNTHCPGFSWLASNRRDIELWFFFSIIWIAVFYIMAKHIFFGEIVYSCLEDFLKIKEITCFHYYCHVVVLEIIQLLASFSLLWNLICTIPAKKIALCAPLRILALCKIHSSQNKCHQNISACLTVEVGYSARVSRQNQNNSFTLLFKLSMPSVTLSLSLFSCH